MAGVTDEQRQHVLGLIRQGKGRNAVAREAGVGLGTVSKIAADNGESFDRSQTITGTRARSADLAAQRSLLEQQLLQDAARLRKQLWEPLEYQQPVGGAEARVMSWETARPMPADQLKIMQAATMAINQSQKIADAASDAGTEQAKSMLGTLMDGLGRAFRDLQQADNQEPA